MIKEVYGDILTPNNTGVLNILVLQQVNCRGVMGAGLAKQIRNKYPGVYVPYVQKCKNISNGIGGLGDIQVFDASHISGYYIVNIFGQYDFGRSGCYTNYNALRKAFTTIAYQAKGYTIRIPYLMGCGLAGGDWNIVYKLIQDILVESGIDVEIWRLA